MPDESPKQTCPGCDAPQTYADKWITRWKCDSFRQNTKFTDTPYCIKRQRDLLSARVDQLEKELEIVIEQRDDARSERNELQERRPILPA